MAFDGAFERRTANVTKMPSAISETPMVFIIIPSLGKRWYLSLWIENIININNFKNHCKCSDKA